MSIMKKMRSLILFFLPVALLAGTTPDSLKTPPVHTIPYDFEHPDATFELPDSLNEISGLTRTKDGAGLYAVNDEEGKVFRINKTTGVVESSFVFRDAGDYEGIEMAGDRLFVVKSSGTLYEIKNPGQPDQEVIKYKFFLTKENNVEGLAYDPGNNRLLLSCKGVGGVGEAFRMTRSVFAFDLGRRVLLEKPALTVSATGCHHYLGNCGHNEHLDQLKEVFADDDQFKFSPSAIAIHPITDEIYMLSSRGKVLLILNRAGEILHIEKLNKNIHPQPEGLCFDDDGTLYLSNERKKAKTATLHVFRYHGDGQ
ncbi:MAG: hypothetical protein D6714_18575 [Bacteroidetes bacterium]|nr:MAG: hypothetical protein D6714_18575 [Bacteroidota bacterium]